MNVWDLGGHSLYRREWATYIMDSDLIVFVIDSFDRGSIGEAKLELH